jgi:hypothetical protein
VVVAAAVAVGSSFCRQKLLLGLALCKLSVGPVVQEPGRLVLLVVQARKDASLSW